MTLKEWECINDIENIKIKQCSYTMRSGWLENANRIELLRFIRAKKGDCNEAWKSIQSHAIWRKSKYGADASKEINGAF